MKRRTLIVLIAFVIGFFSHPAVHYAAAHNAGVSLCTLDVCHGGHHAVASSSNMPCMPACTCRVVPPAVNGRAGLERLLPHPPLFPFRDERPPKS